ncbi:hypothetical protein K4A83_20220 [Spirulina subsalsa FACHB-351]|uniref:Chromosome partition protein Smc n=1 Tax=Spirulina subsalsa FACHB-351 TaxID=234711 RepID=A0ABT3LAR8_9CYAN|nr:hypothetical protein [Spirulina subsalsa]MCW6038580.1 hypothetical protein [Spirulina subsalsa FACHB-351]
MAELNKREMRDRLGNVEQIRDILLGSELRGYEQRFQRLETDLSSLQKEVRDRLDLIQDTLSSEMKAMADALEKKLKYLSLTTHDETTKLWQKIDQTNQKTYNTIEAINKNFAAKTSTLKDDITQTREQLQSETQVLKARIFEELEKGFSNLVENKVSRADLAEILFELCIKVKGTEFVPDLQEAMENRLQAEFLLPENEDDSEERPETASPSGVA